MNQFDFHGYLISVWVDYKQDFPSLSSFNIGLFSIFEVAGEMSEMARTCHISNS